ncbi:MAG: cell division protein FtsQ/DivIB [Alphaproteobacteria bacterium]|nr:cell division protein FtsQ/DivIB [Alphaproteobacteria bacterium]
MSALLLLVLATIACWYSGWPQRQAHNLQDSLISLTKDADFAVKNTVIEGQKHLDPAVITDALGAKQGTPILSVDINEAAEKLGALPWVSTVVVERQLPSTLIVTLTEHVPTARWQNDGHFSVLDEQGSILRAANPENFLSLPLVVGKGADHEATALLNALAAYPDILRKFTSAVRVSDRRWDLHLTQDIIVRLPEEDMKPSLRRLSVLIAEEQILNRPIAVIDLRIPDRLILVPTSSKNGASSS